MQILKEFQIDDLSLQIETRLSAKASQSAI